jgi:formate-dependent nitrite reductase membrane component NrfD
MLAEAQHFVRGPEWTWYILFYFFFAGLAGGSYALASLFRFNGNPADEPAARLGYYVAFVALLPCPVLLTLDLGQPLRFWHMLVNTTPGNEGLAFKYWSPMSVGAWALVLFGAFATVSFVETLVRDRRLRLRIAERAVGLLGGALGKIWVVVGGLFGLFVAGYTGVLLSVSNQPVWSDTWALGGLFLASGLSGSAALLSWLVRYRRDAGASAIVFARSERLFLLLELALIVAFMLTLIMAGTLDVAFGFPWILLWIVAFVSLIPGLAGLPTARAHVTGQGAVVASATAATVVAIVVLIGVLALRAAVIFSAQ